MNSDTGTPQNPQVLQTCPGYISGRCCARQYMRYSSHAGITEKFLESLVPQLGLLLTLGGWVGVCVCTAHACIQHTCMYSCTQAHTGVHMHSVPPI